MKNTLIIFLCIIITLINNYLGNNFPPFSITWTPILIGLFTVLVFYITDFKIFYKYLSLIGLIILNDILIKYFAGGTHDWEGVSWIEAFLVFGLIIAIIIILIYVFTRDKMQKTRYFIYLFLLLVIIFEYDYLFDSLGMTWTNGATHNIELSKKKGLFISDAAFSDSILIFENDTIMIERAWIDKQTITNHQKLFKRIIDTDKNICNIEFKGNFEQMSNDNYIYYALEENKSIGFRFLEKSVSLVFDKNVEYYTVGFYRKDWIKLKEIKIKNGH